MKAIWPGLPGGYVPVAWISMVREGRIRENAKNTHKKQEFFSNVKGAQEAAKRGKR